MNPAEELEKTRQEYSDTRDRMAEVYDCMWDTRTRRIEKYHAMRAAGQHPSYLQLLEYRNLRLGLRSLEKAIEYMDYQDEEMEALLDYWYDRPSKYDYLDKMSEEQSDEH